MSANNSDHNRDNKSLNNNNKLLGSLLLASMTGASVLFGFSTALSAAKRKDANAFNKGLTLLNNSRATREESGASLAMRALGWGTAYACSGFALFCAVVWKALGVDDLQQFRQKVGTLLPAIPRNNPPNSRTEFSSIRDLLQYIIDESDKSKKK